MKSLTKIVLAVTVTVILAGSAVSYVTTPKPMLSSSLSLELGKMVNYPALPQGNFSFGYHGTQTTFSTLANFAIMDWASDIPHGLQLDVKKDSQSLKFPFTNTTLAVGDVSFTVDGHPMALSPKSITTLENGTVVSLLYTYTPQQNFNGTVLMNISFVAYYVVLAGIHHLKIHEGKRSFSKEFTLLS